MLYSAVSVARAPVQTPRTVELDPAAAPGLHRLVGELAGTLQAPVPDRPALAVDGPAQVHGGPRGTATLVIPAAWLWWLRSDELNAVLAPVVLAGAAAADRDIADARRLGGRLDAAHTHRQGHPLVGGPIRALHRACTERLARMEAGIADWSEQQVRTAVPDPEGAARWEAEQAEDAWYALRERFALPAWQLAAAPVDLLAGLPPFVTAHEQGTDALDDRPGQRPTGSPAVDLLVDPADVDHRLVLARRVGGGPAGRDVRRPPGTGG